MITGSKIHGVKIGSFPPESREISMEEKRKDERFELCLNTTLMVVSKRGGEEGKILHLFTKNISSGGAFLTTPKPLPLGTDVRIQMILPLHRLKTLKEKKALLRIEKGAVLRHESNGMAIAFEKGCEIVRPNFYTIH